MSQLIFALRDIKKNIRSVVFFSLQICVLVILITIIVSGFSSYINYHAHFLRLDKYSLTTFDTYYKDSVLDIIFDEAEALEDNSQTTFKKYLFENKGFSFTDGVSIAENETIDVIIGIGAFGSTYLYGDDNKTSVLIGSEVSDLSVGDTVTVEHTENKFIISGILPKNSGFFTKSNLMNLDDKLLLLMSYETFCDMFFNDASVIERDFYEMRLQTNFIAMGSDENETHLIMDEINNSKYVKVIPKSYNNILENQSNILKNNLMFFFLIAVVAIIFMGIGLTYNLLNMVDNNLHEYTISLICGETIFGLCLRTFIYVLLIIAPPILFGFGFLNYIDVVGKISLLSQFLVIILLSIIVSIIPIRKIDINNIALFLRRDS